LPLLGAAVILPSVAQWNAGDQHDADMFNAVSYTFGFLLNPPECEIRQNAAQSIPNNVTTATAITFATAPRDNDQMWDGANPTYVTVKTPGWYEAEWAVSWATKADTTQRMQCVYVNGVFAAVNSFGYNMFINDSTTTPQIWMTYDLFLNIGDRVSVGLMQGTGSALSTASSSTLKDQQTFLRLRWASL
jgi:hypothetical protein